MPARASVPLRLAIGATALLPFETVAKLSLALAAAVFIFQPFELARLYAVVTVLVVQGLARAHRAWTAGYDALQTGEEAETEAAGAADEAPVPYDVVYHEGR
eukprot:5314217-Prymnesium_polylepis.1